MKERADTVIEQRWTHRTVGGVELPLRNILARFRPQATERVLYLTHWDSRPTADAESNKELRAQPVMGANDGAAGVGLFVALGDVLKRTPPSVGVDLLFVDGEDYGSFDKNEDVLIGSRYFAEHLPSPDYQILYGVLWDMLGDSDLEIFLETHSVERAPEVVLMVHRVEHEESTGTTTGPSCFTSGCIRNACIWHSASELGYTRFFVPESKYTVTDDHIPLLDKGLRVIDVIDLDYAAHHTTHDTMERISAASLKIVGDVALALVR